ncbi:MAG: hypothetical protein EHU54_03885, partial [Spiroplasma sp. ald]
FKITRLCKKSNKLHSKYQGETLNKRVNEKIFGISGKGMTLHKKDVFIPQSVLNVFKNDFSEEGKYD